MESEIKAAEAEERASKLAAASAKTRSGSLLYAEQHISLHAVQSAGSAKFQHSALEPTSGFSSHVMFALDMIMML